MLTTDCMCDEAAAGYAHATWCPARTKVPYCEDCGRERYCRCPQQPAAPRPAPTTDPWAAEPAQF